MKKRKLIAPVLIAALSLQMVSCNNALKDRGTKNEQESTRQRETESIQSEEIEAVLKFSDDQKRVVGVENRETATYAVIPEGITAIGYNEENNIGCFSNCKKMTRVTIPDSVTVIDYMAFEGCESLTNIHIPEGVTSIEYGVFRCCESLTDIAISDDIERIDGEAFAGCRNLQSIHIPEGVKSIGHSAFSDCGSLTSVTIPKSVTKIGDEVTTITYGHEEDREGDVVDSDFGNAFEGCYFTKDNFKNNSPLNEIDNLHWGAKIVDSDENGICIKNNVLRYIRPNIRGVITIPDSVKWIGDDVFIDCINNLTNITWKGTTYNSVEEFELANVDMK